MSESFEKEENTMSPLRSIPPITSTGGKATRRLRSADPVRFRGRKADRGEQANPNTHDPQTGEKYHDQYGTGGQQPRQEGGRWGPVSWGGGIGRADRGGGGGGNAAAAPGAFTYTKGQHLAKPAPQKAHKALSCGTCGAAGSKLSGSQWHRNCWWVDCLVCDGRQLAKEIE